MVPILFGVEPIDLTGPLVQFHAARFDKTDIKRVVRMINAELGDNKLAPDVLDSVFDMWWPKLEEKVAPLVTAAAEPDEIDVRSEREILDEVLALTRGLAKGGARTGLSPQAALDVVTGVTRLLTELRSAIVSTSVVDAVTALQAPVRHLVMRGGRPFGTAMTPDVIAGWEQAYKEFVEHTSDTDTDDDLPF